MSLPPLPLLLYADPSWFPSPRKLHIYLAEKQLPSTVVTAVPHADPDASAAYPKIVGKAASANFGPTVPKLAIAKSAASIGSTNQADYAWLAESSAIMEYLEDLCDAYPELSPVPSLRHGADLVSRALVRAELMRSEACWILLGTTLVLGSQAYNQMRGKDSLHAPSAKAVADASKGINLEKLDEIVGEIVDFEGLAGGKVGAATISDVALYGTLSWYRDCHGIDAAKGFANLERFVAAWDKRDTSKAGLPPGGQLPDMVKPFRTGMVEGVWPSAG